MLPNEDENRRRLVSRFAREFTLMSDLASLALNLHEDLCHVDGPDLTANVKEFVVGTLTRDLRRFRSCVELCSMGYPENATILTRSMFESLVAERFVIGTPIEANARSSDLAAALELLPPSPQGRAGEEFRSYLYRAMEPLRMVRLSESIGHESQLLQHTSTWTKVGEEIEKTIGSEWVKRLRKVRHYSGTSVRLCAENHQLLEYYVKVYGLQSSQVHAEDSFRYIACDDDDENSGMALIAGLVNGLELSLFNSGNMLGSLLHDLNGRFSLGYDHQLAELALRIGTCVNAI